MCSSTTWQTNTTERVSVGRAATMPGQRCVHGGCDLGGRAVRRFLQRRDQSLVPRRHQRAERRVRPRPADRHDRARQRRSGGLEAEWDSRSAARSRPTGDIVAFPSCGDQSGGSRSRHERRPGRVRPRPADRRHRARQRRSGRIAGEQRVAHRSRSRRTGATSRSSAPRPTCSGRGSTPTASRTCSSTTARPASPSASASVRAGCRRMRSLLG